MPNNYKDKHGHWTTKENDGGECQHDGGGNAERFDDDYDEEFQIKEDAKYLKDNEFESTEDLNPWDRPDEIDPEYDAKVNEELQRDSNDFDDNYEEEFENDNNPEQKIENVDQAQDFFEKTGLVDDFDVAKLLNFNDHTEVIVYGSYTSGKDMNSLKKAGFKIEKGTPSNIDRYGKGTFSIILPKTNK